MDMRQRLTPQASLRFESGHRGAGEIIEIDPAQTYQTMLGLGSSLEATTCHNFALMPAKDRAEAMEKLVNPKRGIGMNLIRLCIGSSDFTGDPWYSYDDMPKGETDPKLERFSIAKDRDYILPVVKLARRKNPEALFFASPWSPPGWMKTTGTMIGGHLLTQHYPAYAEYFARFIEAYAREGIPIYAVTVQNEPGVDRSLAADPKWFYPSCHWTAEQERDFIRDHLGPTLRRHGLKTKIWCYDHNYNLQPSGNGENDGIGHPRAILADPRAAEFVDAVAFHGYDGEATGMTMLHHEFPAKRIYFTEGSVFDAQGGIDLIERLRNWAGSYNAWVTMLDENGRPNNGPFPATRAILALDSKTRKASYLYEYYQYGQFMKFISRGAVRIGSSEGTKQFNNVAFRNPDGAIVLVIGNSDEKAREFAVRWRGRSIITKLGPQSVEALVWRGR